MKLIEIDLLYVGVQEILRVCDGASLIDSEITDQFTLGNFPGVIQREILPSIKFTCYVKYISFKIFFDAGELRRTTHTRDTILNLGTARTKLQNLLLICEISGRGMSRCCHYILRHADIAGIYSYSYHSTYIICRSRII